MRTHSINRDGGVSIANEALHNSGMNSQQHRLLVQVPAILATLLFAIGYHSALQLDFYLLERDILGS